MFIIVFQHTTETYEKKNLKNEIAKFVKLNLCCYRYIHYHSVPFAHVPDGEAEPCICSVCNRKHGFIRTWIHVGPSPSPYMVTKWVIQA